MSHPRLRSFAVSLAVLALAAAPVGAEEANDALGARTRVLAIELRRGPVSDLEPWLEATADPALRRQAIRALGRIGAAATERITALLSAETEPERALVLWSAGLVMTKDLAAAVRPYLASDDVAVRTAAAAALGWCDDRGVLDDLGPLLLDARPAVRVAALTGLARGGDEGALERAVALLGDPSLEVRDAAWHAAWRLAGRRAQAAKAAQPEGTGDEALVGRLLRDHGAEAERRVDLARVLAGLLPPSARLADPDDDARLQHVLAPRPGDDRGDQEVLWRVLGSRSGPAVDALLERYLVVPNAVTRGQAYEVLATSTSLDRDHVVRAALRRESDPRLLARLRQIPAQRAAAEWLVDDRFGQPAGEIEDQALREADELTSQWMGDEGLDAWNAARAEGGAYEEATWMLLFQEAERRAEAKDERRADERERLPAWLAAFLASKALRAERPYVVVFALDAVATIHDETVDAALLALADAVVEEKPPHDEVERAVVGALVARHDAVEGEAKAPFRARLAVFARSAHSAFARSAAREALEKAGETLPEDDGPSNDWRGLPRPAEPLEAWGLEGSGAWIEEGEILKIADWIGAVKPSVVLETTAGPITVEVDAEAAPVHAVAFVLNAHAGLYNGTRWHRVVPGFVIQGGDPHGHGAGNAGWTVPDEITPTSYARGVLGMPKSVKDDGGCQLFFMLGDCKPLDERYTAYGRVVGSMAAVDAIRIGDRITACRLEIPTK